MNEIRLITFYLPQFHPIPENDHWWGKGFTEWTNVTKATPCFPGHYQPHLPADLGFYDLRVPEVREAQAALAREYGIYGFCYYHYDFSGKRLLERPFREVLSSGKPDFPFCLCWANENWTRTWDGLEDEILIQQQHIPEDDERFIKELLPAFKDHRYIRVHQKLLLIIYRVELLPDARRSAETWRKIVKRELGEELYLCTINHPSFSRDNNDSSHWGFDATVQFPLDGRGEGTLIDKKRFAAVHQVSLDEISEHSFFDYTKVADFMTSLPSPSYTLFRGVFPSWDNTPRRQNSSCIFMKAGPRQYKSFLKKTIALMLKERRGDERLIFINAWNEWAEGAHLEPDQKYGRAYLIATKEALEEVLNGSKSSNSLVEPLKQDLSRGREQYLLADRETNPVEHGFSRYWYRMYLSGIFMKIINKIRFILKKSGWIHIYPDRAEMDSQHLYVVGWALADKEIERVEVYLNNRFIGCATHKVLRSDVKKSFSSVEGSDKSGFYLHTPLPNFIRPENGGYVAVKAIDTDGRSSISVKPCAWINESDCGY